MSLVDKTEPALSVVTDTSVGVLVIESRSTTPLGPKIVYANERMAKLSGYEMGSLMSSPLGLIYDRSDLSALIEKLPAIAARPNHCFMDRALMRNGGTRRPCHWTIRATTREGDDRGFFTLTVKPIVTPDRSAISQRSKGADSAVTCRPKAAPATRSPAEATPSSLTPLGAAASDYTSSRNESISLTAAGVAHDFKNALQTIKSNLELAAVSSPEASRVQTFLNEAHLALGDAEILAHQMLAFTRGEGETKRVFGIGDLLTRVSRLCSAGSGIRCKLYVPADLRCVEGAPTQIYQILHNLVINASQAMPSGGTINLTAGNADLTSSNPYSMPAGRYTVASVKDRGCGIPPDVLPHIFDPNFTTKPEGSGFGLASCQAIIADHGGAIRVASKVGAGTEFLVFLPSTDATADLPTIFSHGRTPEVSPELRPTSGSGRILVVEDQIDVARAARGLLKHLGYESIHSVNGEEAITTYREHLDSDEPIDVVLLDMTLPGGLTGMDVAGEIRRLDPAARLVATSGYFEEGSLANGETGDFAAILPKPYSMASLSEAMEVAITR